MMFKGTKILFLLFLVACNPEIYEGELEDLLPQNSYDWHDIFIAEDRIYSFGGDNWKVASIAMISPEKHEIYTSNEELGSLYNITLCEDKIISYGLYGSVGTIDLQTHDVEFPRLNYWDNIKSVAKLRNGNLIIASGTHNEPRKIASTRCDQWWEIITESDTENPPIQDMIALENDELLACGNSFIMISKDGGKLWSLLSPTDADYIAMKRYKEAIYILSRKGQVLSYDIPSKKFSTVRKTNSNFDKTRYFSALEVDNTGRIYIGAEDGNIYFLSQEWKHLKLPYDEQVNVIKADENKVYIGGNNGFLISIEKPQ